MATVKPPEVDWEELFEEIENKYPINNEPFVTYGLYEDLESLGDPVAQATHDRPLCGHRQVTIQDTM